jgi:hypothetical protein
MSREIDGLMDKLSKINQEMGGEDKKKKKEAGDRFHELKTQVGERLHRLKFVSLFPTARPMISHLIPSRVPTRTCKTQRPRSIAPSTHVKRFDGSKRSERIFAWSARISTSSRPVSSKK